MKVYRYTTLYEQDGATFGGYVDAPSWNEAEEIAVHRGETVDGLLWYSKPLEHIEQMSDEEMVTTLCDLANSHHDGPPEAHEFD